MDKQKILLIIDSLEANLKLLRLELSGSTNTEQKEEEKQPNNTISLRELIGKISEDTGDDYEPDYFEEP